VNALDNARDQLRWWHCCCRSSVLPIATAVAFINRNRILMHIFRAQADERADEQSRVNRQENHRKIESSMRLSPSVLATWVGVPPCAGIFEIFTVEPRSGEITARCQPGIGGASARLSRCGLLPAHCKRGWRTYLEEPACSDTNCVFPQCWCPWDTAVSCILVSTTRPEQ
jgi:hypothetical protein